MGDVSDDSDPLWEGMGSSDRDGVLSSHEIEACVTTHRTRLQFAVARYIQHWTLQRLDMMHVELCQAATAYWNDILLMRLMRMTDAQSGCSLGIRVFPFAPFVSK